MVINEDIIIKKPESKRCFRQLKFDDRLNSPKQKHRHIPKTLWKHITVKNVFLRKHSLSSYFMSPLKMGHIWQLQNGILNPCRFKE